MLSSEIGKPQVHASRKLRRVLTGAVAFGTVSAVRIMPSGFSGEPKGDWINGTARFANPDEMKRAFELRGKKYGSGEGLASSLSSYSELGHPVAIIITPN